MGVVIRELPVGERQQPYFVEYHLRELKLNRQVSIDREQGHAVVGFNVSSTL